MKRYHAYLIDLDGTVYRGNEPIKPAIQFIKTLAEQNVPYLFVTNNSAKTPENVAEKLQKMGIPATKDQVLTSSMATASFIASEKKGALVFPIGETGLIEALKEQKCVITEENPDYVVIGIDREITYEKLAKGCLAIRSGARFISTNGDRAIPTERGLLPGNGSLTSVLSVATDVTPTFIGKPEAEIVNQALAKLHVSKEDVILVGDNYHTDIMAGIKAGIDTLLVYSGVTQKEDLEKVEHQPTYTVDTLTEWF